MKFTSIAFSDILYDAEIFKLFAAIFLHRAKKPGKSNAIESAVDTLSFSKIGANNKRSRTSLAFNLN